MFGQELRIERTFASRFAAILPKPRVNIVQHLIAEMTSSSSTSGSGQSSQSVPSSMESGSTLPTTQDVVDGYFSEPEETESGWGKLIPVGKGFELVGEY